MCNPTMDDDTAAAKSAKAEATESWIVKWSPDPCCDEDEDDEEEDGASAKRRTRRSEIVDASCDVRSVVFENDAEAFEAFRAGGRTARVALADLAARAIREALDDDDDDDGGTAEVRLETLDRRSRPADATTRTGRRRRRRRGRRRRRVDHPFVVERSDARCGDDHRLRATLRARGGSADDDDVVVALLSDRVVPALRSRALAHVACAVLQDRLREALEGADAVAFVGDGSILPRRSGADQRPLPADEVVPTEAPPSLRRSLEVRLGGGLARRLEVGDGAAVSVSPDGAVVSVAGLVVPAGVTLLVGGGYHGKSTLLRAIAAGVANKIPGDGRELCVARRSAVSVRAEDGRHVSDCDLRPFLNLDTLPGRRPDASSDERRFSTSDASGSTSQAAAVVEALEAGATALLLDEDVSAANFLARDGRMRALVRDETITPLLYRVNGMYRALGVSTVVVVGGVGDWLDVAEHTVLRLDGYRLRDASAEARSVSRTFSHHHVQYGGRGVVHRLDWDDRLTPRQRRPVTTTATKDDGDDKGWTVSVEDGRLYVTREEDDDDDEDDVGEIDLDRCERSLVAKAESPAELRGVGLCVARLLEIARDRPTLGTRALLAALDEDLDREPSFLRDRCAERGTVAYRPRTFEVAAALVRRRGTRFAPAPDDDGAAARDEARRAADAEADRARRDLLAAWNDRRRGRNFNDQFR